MAITQNSTKSNLAKPLKRLMGFDFANWLPKQWQHFNAWHLILLPFSWIFLAIVIVRRWLYQHGFLKSYQLAVPVVIVGNINVGGTGKTPLVIYLVEQLRKNGFNPGVISRGYRVDAKTVKEVQVDSFAGEVGDEPLLLKRRLNCPVYIHRDRVLAGQALLAEHPACNMIISDDGLQHYRLQRNIEISVVDATVGFGNGAVLPAGPLREPMSRLKAVDAIVINGSLSGKDAFTERFGNQLHEMQIEATKFYNLKTPTLTCDAENFIGYKTIAIAGIGNPARFYQQLAFFNLNFIKHSFPDHYAFTEDDFSKLDADFIIMTEKDAVKCQSFAKPNFWVLPISASLDEGFMMRLLQQLTLIDN